MKKEYISPDFELLPVEIITDVLTMSKDPEVTIDTQGESLPDDW